GVLPFELQGIIASVKKKITVPLGLHAHDDSGVAVANSLVAVKEGCSHIQGTINGYGERCGNANLCTIIPNLKLKLGIDCLKEDALANLTTLSRFVSETANLLHQDNLPYVGKKAFAHKGGIHVDAVLKKSLTYEHVDPDLVGNKRRILISELAGRSNILYKARENNIQLNKKIPETKKILEMLKRMEYEGYQFEGAEASFELLLWKAIRPYKPLFQLEGFRVITEKRGAGEVITEATLKTVVKEKTYLTAAEGNGPVNALDHALRKALEQVYPVLKKIQLVDFKVRVLDGKDGTGAKVRVLIETRDKEKSWSTIGVSTNIIEASWISLVDSIEYGLLCKAEKDFAGIKEDIKNLAGFSAN
ncbi:MAG TPA: citramalate synthase, partial [Firmicutes bacterium]|nr:citramalate synthase [Bacillota bacterium]